MKRRSYEERFRIPLDGDSNVEFFTKSGLFVAIGFTRIVIGGRGPYIEFSPDQIIMDNLYVPKHAEHKLAMSLTYYHEYRSKDQCFVKVYHQKMGVTYADYLIDMFYIAPSDLKTAEFEDLLLPLYPDPPSPDPTLFDKL